jgi:hypothetical protein
MNCTALDLAVDEAHTLVTSDAGFYVGCGALLLVSVVLLVLGETWVRPLGAVVGGTAAAVAVYVLSALVDDVPCTGRLVSAAVAGVLAACLVLCLLKAGLFVLGASAFGTLAHFAYEAMPFLDDLDPPFVFLERSGYYYIVVGAAGVVGAVVSHVQRTQVVRITTSLLGGGGLALTTHLVVARESEQGVPDVALLGILLVSTVVGVVVQTRIAKRRKTRRVVVERE